MANEAQDKYSRLGDMVAHMQRGNMDFFEPFYQETQKMVYFELKAAGVKESEIYDLTQEVYIRFVNKIDSIQDTRAVYKWLKQTSYRIGLNHVTSSASRHEQLIGEDEAYRFESEDNLSAPIPMPEDIMENRVSQEMIRQILRELPELQYKMIFAFYYNESSVKEIATMLKVPEGTVKTNLFRARNEIKSRVEMIEKKQGIRLHAVIAAPILMFLFETEAKAMTMEGITFAEAKDFLGKTGVFEQMGTQVSAADVRNPDAETNEGGPSRGIEVPGRSGINAGIKILIAGAGITILVLGTALFFAYKLLTPQQNLSQDTIAEKDEQIAVSTGLQEEKNKFSRMEQESEMDNAKTEQHGEENTEDLGKEVKEADNVADDIVYQGELRFLRNNHDGTFSCAYLQIAEIEKTVVENANIGDIIVSVGGREYQIIEGSAVRDEEGDFEECIQMFGYYDKGVFLVGGEEYWDCYYLKKNQSGNYSVIYPDANIAISEESEELTLGVADNAQIQMTCFEEDDSDYLTIIPGNDFKNLSFIAGDFVQNPIYNGKKIYDYTAGFSGEATVENGMITAFKETFRE